VDTQWAQTAVSDLASVPLENNHPKRDIESLPQQQLSVHSPPLISVATNSFFPPQRVEPIDMARSNQQTSSNRQKTGYTQSATTDEHQATAPYMQNRPIQHVKHPADRSSFIFLLQHLSDMCFALFVSLPCVLLITLLVPICWLIRVFLRLTCRFQCTVTPCSCSYLSASDLFWFYNDQMASDREKTDEMTKISASSVAPTAAAIFFLEGHLRSFDKRDGSMNCFSLSPCRYH
jgi:hypothetical protein